MKRKTTLYMEEEDIRELKKLALEEPNQNMTSLITQAVRHFINDKKEKQNSFAGLKKCKNSVKKNYFGEGVKLQRKLRKEWDN